MPSKGAWSLVVLQSTSKSQGAQTGVCARGGVLKCGWGCQVRWPGACIFYRVLSSNRGLGWDILPEEECLCAGRLPGQGAWSLVLLQSIIKYQGGREGVHEEQSLCAAEGVWSLKCGAICATHIATFHMDFLSTFSLSISKGQQWVFFGAFPWLK